MERGTLRTKPFGQQRAFKAQLAQSCLLAQLSIVGPSFTNIPVVVSILPPGQV
jgi:hypothetical protein